MKDVLQKLPNNFLQKIKKVYPTLYPQICETFLHKKEPTFRINFLKTDLTSLRKKLVAEKIKCKELSWPTGSFILKSDFRKFQAGTVYAEGLVYVQNVSSMIPPLLLEPQPGEKILDLCAAPGAKTTQLASLTGGQAEIVAFEKARIRYYKLLANLKIQGADFVETHMLDGSMARKKFFEYFDKVLVDAPCSVEGLFYVNNPRTYKYWKDRKVKEMRHVQKKLLMAGLQALRPQGTLVYSTCTFSPEENEEVVSWALGKYKEELKVEKISLPLNSVRPGLSRWKESRFDPRVSRAVRILPNSYLEGFFVARLKKI